MNYSTAVMLVNQNIRAINCSYEPDLVDANGKVTKRYDRYTYKTLDQTLRPGDYVVVPTDSRHKMTVIRVEEVDVDVDFDSSLEIKWVISRVDTDAHSAILTEETKWIEALKKSEKRHKREEIKKKMLDFYTEENATALPIANMTGSTSATAEIEYAPAAATGTDG